jgi:GTP-binding protein
MTQALPIVALIGRPNVGKSSLFNRLLGFSKALTHDLPGVTRDRIYGEVRRPKDPLVRPFALVDTGGLEPESGEDIKRAVLSQAREALQEAVLVLMVVDGREGLSALDEQVAALLRGADKPVLLVVNKVDGEEKEALLTAEFHQLGFPVVAVSAAHGLGITQLLDMVLDKLPPEDLPSTETGAALAHSEEGLDEKTGLRLALLGRPNVGKSSIINTLLGFERQIVSDQPGTTRDSVDISWQVGEKTYTLVDTAGVRKRTRIQDSLERFSVLKSLRSSKKAQVTMLVLDALEGLTFQDKKLLAFLDREKTALIAVVNKIDLIPKSALNALKQRFKDDLAFAAHVPLVFTSAVSRAGLGGLLPLAERIWTQCQTRISTGQLNRVMSEATQRHQPALVNQRRAKFFYLTQTDIAPPTFVFFVNDAGLIRQEYVRYLENQLRKRFGLNLAPLQLHFRSRQGRSTKA